MLKKNVVTKILTASLLVTSTFSFVGCQDEDESNDSAEAAYQGGQRAFQLWTGDEDFPENPYAIGWPNGKGTLVQGSGPLDIGEFDCWPVSLFDPATWEVGDVAYFQAALLVQPNTAGIVYWKARESFGGSDGSWIHMSEPYVFRNLDDKKGEWHYFTLPVDDAYLLYSMDIFGGGDYRFGLIPIYN